MQKKDVSGSSRRPFETLMIKGTTLIAAILFSILPLSSAQGTRIRGSLSFSAFASAGLPLGPDHFTKIWNPGVGFGTEARYHLTRMDALSVGFTFQPFRLDGREFLESVGPILGATWEIKGGGSIQTSCISVDYIRYFTPPESSLGFYLMAGGGIYLKRPKDVNIEATIIYPGLPKIQSTVKTDEPENKPGLNGGAGLELSLASRMDFVIEAKYHVFFTQNKNTSFITFMGGLRITI
jgi:hypothetical protein